MDKSIFIALSLFYYLFISSTVYFKKAQFKNSIYFCAFYQYMQYSICIIPVLHFYLYTNTLKNISFHYEIDFWHILLYYIFHWKTEV